MDFPNSKVDVKKCKREEPPHPCDGPIPCDPNKTTGECPLPFLCLEKVKNPAFEGEQVRCIPGPTINAKSCIKPEPPHPCDPLPPCSSIKDDNKTIPCNEPALCIERIKNPEGKKKDKAPCDETK